MPQSLVLGTVIMRRHLPICRTRGTLEPVGTLFSLNDPSAPVNANVTKSPIDMSHELHVFVPCSITGRLLTLFGTKTTTFWSGFLPAGS